MTDHDPFAPIDTSGAMDQFAVGDFAADESVVITPVRANVERERDLEPHRFEASVRRLIYDFRPWRDSDGQVSRVARRIFVVFDSSGHFTPERDRGEGAVDFKLHSIVHQFPSS